MQNYNLISSILAKPWLLDPRWAEANLALVASLLEGKAVNLPSKPMATVPNDAPEAWQEDLMHRPRVIDVSAGTVKASFWHSFDEAPKGSLAMIPVIGPISKYYNCGVPGSSDITRWVKAADESSKIDGILLVFDTPGGMVDGTATLADAIKNCSKPTVGFVDDGMAASAGMWLISACDEIILSQKTDMVGSIGVYTQLADFSERLKQMGIKLHEVYAPQSTEKNADYKEGLKGNYGPIQEELSFLAETFINTIKTNREGKLNLEQADPFKGKMFFAEEAISIGLADRIGTIEDAIASCYGRVGVVKSNSKSKSNTNMFGNKFPTLSGLKGKKAEEVSEEDITKVNAELAKEGISAVSVFPQSFQADAKKLQEENETAQSDLEKANSDLASAQKALKDEQEAHAKTKNELAALKNSAGKSQPKPGAEADPGETNDENEQFLSEVDVRAAELRKELA